MEQLVEELLLRGISVVEGVMLEINGANGVLRIDLPRDEIARAPARKVPGSKR